MSVDCHRAQKDLKTKEYWSFQPALWLSLATDRSLFKSFYYLQQSIHESGRCRSFLSYLATFWLFRLSRFSFYINKETLEQQRHRRNISKCITVRFQNVLFLYYCYFIPLTFSLYSNGIELLKLHFYHY